MSYTSEPLQMPDSQAGDAPQRPMVFDNNPNARSKTMETVPGAHTYGALNTVPAETGAFTVGLAENIGSRRSMEDAFSFVVDFAGIQGQGFFAIFDGHAGKHAAEWCGQNFHNYLLNELIANPAQDVAETIAQTFLNADQEISKLSDSGTTQSGCTAATVFLRLEDAQGKQSFAPPIETLVSQAGPGSGRSSASPPPPQVQSLSPNSWKDFPIGRIKSALGGGGTSKKPPILEVPKIPGLNPAFKPEGPVRKVLYTANAGDARAVLSRSGKAARLTYDHKGTDMKEVKRIQEAGGFVLNNRVNGVLAVTRSLGDSAMKEYVVGHPYTSQMELTDRDEFLIVACDGLWDVAEDQQAVDLIKDFTDATAAAKALVQHALDNFSHDNITVLVVKFGGPGQPFIADSGRAST